MERQADVIIGSEASLIGCSHLRQGINVDINFLCSFYLFQNCNSYGFVCLMLPNWKARLELEGSSWASLCRFEDRFHVVFGWYFDLHLSASTV
jgi:hypothetical protein